MPMLQYWSIFHTPTNTASISGSGWSVYFSEGVTPSSSLIPGIVEDFHRYAPDPTRSYHGRRG
jgi:hypothetical protein